MDPSLVRLINDRFLDSTTHASHSDRECMFFAPDTHEGFCALCAIAALSHPSVGLARRSTLLHDLSQVRLKKPVNGITEMSHYLPPSVRC